MIQFHCPHCDKTLKTSQDRAGLQAKCPGCGEIVVVPTQPNDSTSFAPQQDEPSISQEFPDAPFDGTSAARDETDVRCPVCGEPILANQTRCALCGAAFERDEMHPERLSRRRETRPFPPGEVISEALRIYGSRWGLLTAAFLVKVALIGLPSTILLGGLVLLERILDGNADDFVALAGLGGTIVVFSVVTLALSMHLQAGSFVLHLKVAREQPATVSDLFSGAPYWGRMMICGLLVNLMSA